MTDISSLSQNNQDKTAELSSLLDAYVGWLLKFPTYFLYPEETQELQGMTALDAVDHWLAGLKESGFSERSFAQIEAVHLDVKRVINDFLETFAMRGLVPSYQDYLGLMALFEEFVALAKRVIAEKNGTGTQISSQFLRPITFLENDLQRELDRLSRNGKPFCLAYVRLMHSDEEAQEAHILANPEILEKVSEIFYEALRSYDDAYQISGSDLVVSLKQIGTYDALSTMERLARSLEKHGNVFKTVDGHSFQVSLSYYVLQQHPDKEPAEILELLKKNIDDIGNKSKKIFSYREVSSLQRFIRDEIVAENGNG